MIEARQVIYDWATTPNGSVSQKKFNGDVVGINWVKNPNANGSTSSFSSATPTTYTGGSRARAYKGTASSAGAASYGLTTAEQPSASAGDTWWAHALVQADSTVVGARKVTLVCRFRSASGGTILGSVSSSQDIIPAGVFHRWTGTAYASTSEEYSGTSKRVNYALAPTLPNATDPGTSVISASGAGQFTRSAVQGAPSGKYFFRATANNTSGASAVGAGMFTPSVPAGTYLVSFWFRHSDTAAMGVAPYVEGTATAASPVPSDLIVVQPNVWTQIVYSVTTSTAGTLKPGLFAQASAAGVTADYADFLVEKTNVTVPGTLFDGSTTNTGTGNDSNVYELSVEGVAPAGTGAVEVAVVRESSYGAATGDILWFTDMGLIQPNSNTSKAYFDGDYPDSTDYVYVERPGEVTTDEWLEVNGIPLNTLAWNITTWGGNRQSPPSLRGANVTVPGRPGAIFKARELDTQTYTLNMWVQGSLADGSRPTDLDAIHQYDKNWKMLRSLLFTARNLLKVTKRWYDPESKAIRAATGYAQFNGGLEPSMTGRARSMFSVDLLFPDPFFYETTHEVSVATTQNNTWVETVDGDWRTTAITVSITGVRTNPKITVTHPDGSQTWAQYNGTLAAGDTLLLDVNKFSAQLTSGGTTRQVSGRITHGGAAAWLALEPGVNTIVLTSNNGTGPVSLAYDAVWF